MTEPDAYASAPSFDFLTRRYRRMVMAVIFRITGSTAETEDLTQQTFMKAFINYSRFEGRSSFSTWLISIARNEALMWRRQARRSREIAMTEMSSGENPDITLDFMDPEPGPETIYLKKEQTRLLFSEMKHLRPGMRAALELCDLEEWSCAEAAVVLDLSTSSVKSRKFRGRAILRRRLDSVLFPAKSEGGAKLRPRRKPVALTTAL